MLYMCRPISAEAAVYFAAGKKNSGAKASIKTDHAKTPHVTHKLRQTQFLELVCIERKTASPDTTRKTTSTARHHVGAPLQQVLELISPAPSRAFKDTRARVAAMGAVAEAAARPGRRRRQPLRWPGSAPCDRAPGRRRLRRQTSAPS